MKTITIILCLTVTTFTYGQDNPVNKLTLDDYLNYETVSSPRISPSGDQVLYTRTWINAIDDKRNSDLWIVSSSGNQNRFFLNGRNGRWSPDSRKVAFIDEGEPKGSQIFVKHLGLEGEPTQITRIERSPGNISWSPNGQHIAFTMFVENKEKWNIKIPSPPKDAKWTKAPTIIDDVVYRRDRVGFLGEGNTHIFVVSSEGGTARQITSGDYNHSGSFTWANGSKNIIFSSLRIPDADYAYRESNLYSVNIPSGKISPLTDRKGRESTPKISPDNKKIAFIGSIWTENFYHKSRVFIMDTDGSNIKMISENLDENPRGLFWAADNSGVYFNLNDHGTRNLYFVSVKGNAKKVSSGNHMLTISDVNKNGTGVGVITSPYAPPDIVSMNLKNPSIRKLTSVNKDILDYVKLGEVEEIKYSSTDGLDIQGWIVKPPDFDAEKKYPLILKIHGGPHGMYNVGFNFTNQLHAADGYILLYTNPRGSTGYGYDFANAIQNAYPGKDYDDLMKGVDEVIKNGYIDEQRLFVYGGSGGGVLTSWIIGHSDRFAAASVNYPVINWLSFVGTTDGIGWYRNFEKYPWEDPSEHLKRSPLMYVGNVTTPTMLMTGVKDLRTPISQTEEFYQALKIQKVPTVMIRFNGEFHGTSSKPSNYLRTIGYLNHWFSKYDKLKMDTRLNKAK
ncbi:MAG: S9 family peptidase [Bacteroidetes bacterium]|nr:S9 family peptidase [Bacteroidota bacterium]